MKKIIQLISILLFVCIACSNLYASVITSNILTRVFLIKYKNSTGTAFTIEVDDRQYLITAKHVVNGIGKTDTIEIFHDRKWENIPVTSMSCENNEIDITILVPPVQLSPSFELIPSMANLVIAQDVYFLGFPYMMFSEDKGLNRDFPFPFVKKGICSSLGNWDGSKALIYIDGHNNPGFSGGPIVFQDLYTKKLKVAGVISGYRNHPDPVIDKGLDTGLVAMSNSGIVVGYSIKPAIEAIKKNPIGPKVMKTE